MVKDHRQLQDELTSLARKKSITLPTSPDKGAEAAYKKFNNASGADHLDHSIACQKKYQK